MLSPGTRIGVYEVTGLLGAGGMGEVYRARDTRLGRDVAVKVLPPALASDSEYISRFQREAHALASLNHPNIAAIYGLEDRAFIMELVEGMTLADWIAGGAKRLDEVLPVAMQICEALEAAHERGIIHRDLKPSNVKITPEGRIKLLDFGLARSNETAAHAATTPNSPTFTIAATMPGILLGTVAYMAPEQARGVRADHRSDIWSFGVVLYEMLTGRVPFTGNTVSDTIAAVLTSDPDMTAVPDTIRPVLRRCVERDLRKRYGWIGEVRLALEASQHAPVAPVPVGQPRRWLIRAGLIAAGAAAGAGLVRYGMPRRSPTARVARRLTQLTRDGRSMVPSVSADGKLVCYLSQRGDRGQWDLWVQQVSGGAAIRVVDNVSVYFYAARPEFSADASRIYYRSDNPPAGIYEVPSLGGDARLFIAGALSARPSPDGKWIAWTDGSRLLLRSSDGGDDRELLPGDRIDPLLFVWAPDSERLLVAVIRSKQPVPGSKIEREMLITPLHGTPKHIDDPGISGLEQKGFSNLNLVTFIAWLPGDDIVVPLRFGDAVNLYKLPLRGLGESMPEQLTFGAWNNGDAGIAGKHLVFTTHHESSQIWSLPADLNAGRVFGPPRPVTPEQVEMQFQTVSPDNSMLAYVSRRTGGQGLYVLDLRTGKERTLLPPKAIASYPVWSPDGKQIAYSKYPEGISVIAAAGGPPVRICQTVGRLRSWTADGRYLVLWTGNPPPLSVGVLDVNTGAIHVVYGNGRADFIEPRLSPNGKFVAFVSRTPEMQRLYVAPFRGAQRVAENEWVPVADNARYAFWSPDSSFLFFVSGSLARVSPSVQRQEIDGAGKLVGTATEFCRLEGFVLTTSTLNTISVGMREVFFLFNARESDVWLTEV